MNTLVAVTAAGRTRIVRPATVPRIVREQRAAVQVRTVRRFAADEARRRIGAAAMRWLVWSSPDDDSGDDLAAAVASTPRVIP